MIKSLYKSMQRCVLTGALATSLVILPTANLAADEADIYDEEVEVPAGDEPTPGIETIVVYAQKKEQNVQDIGFSISAFSQADLVGAGIYDVSRLEFLIPGVNFAYAGNDAKINVRGANASQTFGDNSAIVGAFVDGVYKLRASQQTRAFFDVKRLEFLKGPQGTLYGRNTFAGAINLYTNTPDLAEFAAGIDGSYERFNRTRFEGFVNLPVTEKFGLRVAGFFDRSDGFIENTAGHNLGAPNDKGIRVSALFEPTDALTFLARYHFISETGYEAGLFGYTTVCRNVTPSGHTDSFGSNKDCANAERGSGGTPTVGGDPYKVSQDFAPKAKLSEHVFSFDIDVALGPVDVKSITSYTNYKNNIGFDFDFSPTPVNQGGFNEVAESWTQEVQLSFVPDSDSWFVPQVTGGLYYSNDKTNFQFYLHNQRLFDARTPSPVFDNAGDPVLTDPMDPGSPQLMLPVLSGTPLVNNDLVLNPNFADTHPLETDYLGIYAQTEFSLPWDLQLIGGARFNWEDKELQGGGSNFTAAGPVTFLPTEVPDSQGEYPKTVGGNLGLWAFDSSAPGAVYAHHAADTKVTWRTGLEWHGLDDVLEALDSSMLYFTASTGFLSGAQNRDGTKTDAQDSRVLEWGMKSKSLDNTLLVNLAVHYTTYENLLTQKQVLVGGTAITESINGGDISAWGIELESIWAPTPEVTLGLLAAYLDSEYTSFGQTNPYQLFRGAQVDFVDMTGEQTPWSPKFTVTLYASYLFDLGKYGWLTPYAQFYYSEGYNTSNLFIIDPVFDQSHFTKTDLRLTWNSPAYAYFFQAFVENVEDKAVLARSNNNSQDGAQTGFNYPRNYGVRFGATF